MKCEYILIQSTDNVFCCRFFSYYIVGCMPRERRSCYLEGADSGDEEMYRILEQGFTAGTRLAAGALPYP